MSPSLRHQFLAWAVPRVRKSRDLDDVEAERARIERWHAGLDRTRCRRGWCRASTSGSRSSRRRPAASRRTSSDAAAHSSPSGRSCSCTAAAFMAPIDPFHVRYAARLATGAARAGGDARLPARTRAHLARLVRADDRPRRALGQGAGRRWSSYGDSAGGGYALALAMALRDRGGPQPTDAAAALAVGRPVDEHARRRSRWRAIDPWLFLGKLHAYAEWWAGSPRTSARPEVSPALGDLSGLPPTLMFCGTRDRWCRAAGSCCPTCGRGRLAADLRRGARPDPRLRAAAVHPRGPEGVAPDAGVPRDDQQRRAFDDLDARAAYDVWRLRQDVFVVEQECPYPDLDGRDLEPGTRHVLLARRRRP